MHHTTRAHGAQAAPVHPNFAAKLQEEVAAFNRRFAVGDPVEYYEVVESGQSTRHRTRTAAQVLGHIAVVWLEGKSGCVACSHCFMPAGVQG